MKKTIFTFFVLLLVISSCKKEEMPEPIVTPEPQTIITYASIKSIVDNNCVQCHATAQNTYIADFTSYANLSSYLDNPDNTMIDRLNSDEEFYKMPPNGELSQIDKDLLIAWINDGYIE